MTGIFHFRCLCEKSQKVCFCLEIFELIYMLWLLITARDFRPKGRKIESWWWQANFSLYIFYHLFDNLCIIYIIYKVRQNYSYWLIRRIGPPVPILRKTERLHLVSMHYYYSPIIIRNNVQLFKRVALFWPWTKWSVTLDLLAFFRTAFVGGSHYGHPERRHLIFLKEKSVFSL